MSVVSAAIDCTEQGRKIRIQSILRHLPTDSACLRDEPGDVEHKQNSVFSPFVTFAGERLGTNITVGHHIFGLSHPLSYAKHVVNFLNGLDNLRLTGINMYTR